MIEPRFEIGQQVWHVRISTKTEQYPCPDCDGTKVWFALTAACEHLPVQCARCSLFSPLGNKLPSLAYFHKIMSVEPLTIGAYQVRSDLDTNRQVSYMCRETGVGTGSVYYESDLYPTEQEAAAAAVAQQDAAQAEEDGKPAALLAAAFAQMPLQVALAAATRLDTYAAWTQARYYREAIEEVLQDEALSEDNRSALEYGIEDRAWVVPPHPVDMLIAAAEAVLKVAESATFLPGPVYLSPQEVAGLREALKGLRPKAE